MRRVAAFTACAAVAVTLVVAPACLPDLVTAASANGAADAPTVIAVVPPTCGDGVIDSVDNGAATNEQCDPGDAGSVGCTEDCKIACDGGAIDTMGHCYYAPGATPTYPDAPSLCLAARGHVVTFASQREVDFVNDAGLVDGGFWAGLQLIPAVGYVAPRFLEPGWPATGNACPGCFAVGVDDAGRFANEDAGSDCVVAGGARWTDHACGGGREIVSVVCEREPVGQRIYFCGGPNCTDLPATFGSKRYVLPTELVTGTDAVAVCAPYGSLVMLDSAEEREQLVRELVTRYPAPQTIWVGLTVRAGVSIWDDGDAGRPAPWANDEPATDGRAFLSIADPQVITFDTQLAHVDGDPAARRLVVCQRK